MKKFLLVLVLVSTTSALAQSGFGVKGGINYSDNGKVEYSDFIGAGENILEENANRRRGYHVGVFYHLNLGPVYLRPEMMYTQTISSYSYKSRNADFDVSKVDLPILLGIQVLGPVHIFAGPSLQYILDSDFGGLTLEELETEFTIGGQFGLGIQIGKLGLDARYEQALSQRQANVMDQIGGTGYERLDSRPNQFILSLSINL